MRSAGAFLIAALCAGCTTPLERGERLYREGDRLGALETWRSAEDSGGEESDLRERIAAVEAEFDRLVVQYKQRGRYYEGNERLAESILNLRLALKLQPDDQQTLDHVQELARTLTARKRELEDAYRSALVAKSLAEARRLLATMRNLDPFDPELETAERQLQTALRGEIERRMSEGRRGFASGNYAAASSAFGSVLDLDPDNSSARGYLSYIATLRAESERAPRRRGPVAAAGADAEAPFGFGASSFATDAQIRAEGYYQNALAAERRGDPFTAIRHDLRALEADASHRRARAHLAALRRRLAPEVAGLVESGRTAFRAEDLQSALDLWRRALLVDPDNERVLAYIGRAEQQLQNLERLRAEPAGGEGG